MSQTALSTVDAKDPNQSSLQNGDGQNESQASGLPEA